MDEQESLLAADDEEGDAVARIFDASDVRGALPFLFVEGEDGEGPGEAVVGLVLDFSHFLQVRRELEAHHHATFGRKAGLDVDIDERLHRHTVYHVPMDAIQGVIHGRARDLGGNFMVRRVLPSMQRRLVGPFIFFDHFGPVEMPAGKGMDVRPHPHISLATVTYLYEGEIFHRDSLGNAQSIKPGDVNWMTAGRGIVHSERSSDEVRARGQRMHGLQTWVALPLGSEEVEPSFAHHDASSLPQVEGEGWTARVILGTALGKTSPVKTLSPTLYVDVQLADGAELEVPEAEERALYVTEGKIALDDEEFEVGTMAVLLPEFVVRMRAIGKTRVMIAGGDKLEGERHIYWNFVSSSEERIEKAKRDWSEGRFPKVPGDETEFIPLPE